MSEAAVMTEEERAGLEAELDQLAPGWTLRQFADLESLSPDDRKLAIDSLKALGKLSWAKPPGALDRVLAILNILASVASPIATIASGFSGVEVAIKTITG